MAIERLPRLAITLEGSPLTPTGPYPAGALTQVTVTQALSLPTQCELVFTDPPGPLQELESVAVGASLRIIVDETPEPLFVGQVTAVEHLYLPAGQNEIRLRAYDYSHALRKRQTVRTHVQQTTQELGESLLADLPLTLQAAEPGLLQARLIQHVQTDYELLVSQLAQNGLAYYVRDQVLHLITLAGFADAPIALELGQTLVEARCEINSDQAADAVAATGWSMLQVENYGGTQSNARSGRQATAVASAPAANGYGQRRLVDQSVVSAGHVEALAQAELDRRQAGGVHFWGVARGDAALFPGRVVDVRGVAAGLSGRYVLTTATHSIDAQHGYLTEVTTVPPKIRLPRPDTTALLGEVTDVDDPERRGRVRVALPTYEAVETEWLYVISAAAGQDKGLVMLPGVGDQVLVLFNERELGQAVVIGGFYAPEAIYDSGVEGGAVRRYSLRTPDGHILQMDDAGRKVRLEDSHGNHIEMTPQKVSLFANTDLEISAPGRTIVIQAAAIDFKRV